MKELKLKERTRAIRGFQSLKTEIVNLIFVIFMVDSIYIYYQKIEDENKNNNKLQIEMSDLKGRIVQNY